MSPGVVRIPKTPNLKNRKLQQMRQQTFSEDVQNLLKVRASLLEAINGDVGLQLKHI